MCLTSHACCSLRTVQQTGPYDQAHTKGPTDEHYCFLQPTYMVTTSPLWCLSSFSLRLYQQMFLAAF